MAMPENQIAAVVHQQVGERVTENKCFGLEPPIQIKWNCGLR